MNVLLAARPDHARRIGGDRVVIEALRDEFTRLGHRVSVSSDPSPDLTAIDVVHLFNLEAMPVTFFQAGAAIRQGRPYVVTPFYWTPAESAPPTSYPLTDRVMRRLLPARAIDALAVGRAARRAGLSRHALRALPSRNRQGLRAEVLRSAVTVIASCDAERVRLERDFPFLRNAPVVSMAFGAAATPDEMPSVAVPVPGFFLCVGGIGPRKNQLGLARALRSIPDARLVCIGDPAPGSARYLRSVRDAAPPGSLFLPAQPHGALRRFYASARAVVQPSFIELPGLVALEATLSGAAVVVSDRPPVREYLDGAATFVDPLSTSSIRAGCLASKPATPSQIQAIRARCSWRTHAEGLSQLYTSMATR